MIDGVLSGRLAAAFVDGPVLHPALEGVPAFEEEMVLIAPLNHEPIHRAKDVNGENIYAFRSNCSYRHHFESWFADGAAVPGKIFEMESYHGMLACVSAGAGLALMPAACSKACLDARRSASGRCRSRSAICAPGWCGAGERCRGA